MVGGVPYVLTVLRSYLFRVPHSFRAPLFPSAVAPHLREGRKGWARGASQSKVFCRNRSPAMLPNGRRLCIVQVLHAVRASISTEMNAQLHVWTGDRQFCPTYLVLPLEGSHQVFGRRLRKSPSLKTRFNFSRFRELLCDRLDVDRYAILGHVKFVDRAEVGMRLQNCCWE